MHYRCLKRQMRASGKYTLVPIREEDMQAIRIWRNDQIDVLRQRVPLSEEDQRRYYEQVVRPSFDDPKPDLILFSYLLDGVLIGYGGLTHVDWCADRAEVSFLLETARTTDEKQYAYEFGVFLRVLQDVAFGDLGLNRLFAETYDIRPHHVAVLEQNGFEPEGRLRQHIKIQGRYVDALIHGCLKAWWECERHVLER